MVQSVPEGLPRKADRVAGDLLTRIVGGDLDVGTILPKENELADAFAVNRSVVREAVKLLEVHRLVRPVRRRGTEVLDPLASLSPEVLRCMLRPPGGPIDRSVLRDLLEVRTDLDTQMCGLAAERRTEADLAKMDQGTADVREALHRGSGYVEAVDALSLAMSRATHNRIFEMLAHWNRLVTTDLVDVFHATRPASTAYVDGLMLIVELVRQQDAEQARAVVRAYHEWATPRLLVAAALHDGVPLSEAMEELKP